LNGFRRNLTPAEIVAQIFEAEFQTKKKINNLVFMGMGEPLANYKNLILAVEQINAPWGFNIGARHITISTSGLVPEIKKLADQPKQLQLAISLHAVSDTVRNIIMPINKKYSLEKLIEACQHYVSKKQKMITFEYILIKDINDFLDHASLLANLAKKLHAKINLIPYNPVSSLTWQRPSQNTINAFHKKLLSRGAKVTLRKEKGTDIDAACGQLRLRELNS
jgi:23S rRNA (adenine2503-C2)-methyltransferase